MEIYSNTVPDRTKNACAVKLMRNMLVKYALKHNISSEEAMLRFAESMTCLLYTSSRSPQDPAGARKPCRLHNKTSI